MTGRKNRGFRNQFVSMDDSLIDQIGFFSDAHGISFSAAARCFLRLGLKCAMEEEYDSEFFEEIVNLEEEDPRRGGRKKGVKYSYHKSGSMGKYRPR